MKRFVVLAIAAFAFALIASASAMAIGEPMVQPAEATNMALPVDSTIMGQDVTSGLQQLAGVVGQTKDALEQSLGQPQLMYADPDNDGNQIYAFELQFSGGSREAEHRVVVDFEVNGSGSVVSMQKVS